MWRDTVGSGLGKSYLKKNAWHFQFTVCRICRSKGCQRNRILFFGKILEKFRSVEIKEFSRSPRRPSGIKLEPFQFRELHLKENILVPLVI